MSTPPPTIRDVASAAGVSVATVSRALGSNRDIADATREQVREVAERLGYRRNMAAAILGATGKGQRTGERPPIGFISYRPGHPDEGAIRGFQATATDLGHRAEATTLNHIKELPRALQRFHAKGCQGIILRVLGEPRFWECASEWDRFAVLNIESLTAAPFNQLRRSHFDDVHAAWEQLVARGYKRIGAGILSHGYFEGSDQVRLGAVLSCQDRYAHLSAIPPYRARFEEQDATFAEWLRDYRPDAVIGFGPQFFWWLDKRDIRVPDDVGLLVLHGAGKRICMKNGGTSPEISGFDVQPRTVLQTALPLLDHMLARRQLGIPLKRQLIEFSGDWVEGATLRPLQRTACA